jgi:hypothetical protein
MGRLKMNLMFLWAINSGVICFNSYLMGVHWMQHDLVLFYIDLSVTIGLTLVCLLAVWKHEQVNALYKQFFRQAKGEFDRTKFK